MEINLWMLKARETPRAASASLSIKVGKMRVSEYGRL